MKKHILISAGTGIILAISGTFFLYGRYHEEAKYHGQREDEEAVRMEAAVEAFGEGDGTGDSRTEDQKYCVFVCGEVREEGICYLSKDARIFEAVEAAGGFSEEADTTYWNLAEKVYDGQRIYVPKVGEEIPEHLASDNMYDASGRLDLNAATAEALVKLPGIGQKKAEDIISYRKTVGRFQTTEELMNISGIKESLYQSIRDKICVR
ncbi:MAG: helix-hairpin-helix domain-containing protein [Lachnospiraceae bacterium]|nr:helix-hairpin-helix domain-containing protein [Lachnospiraceae bacterium]